MKSSPEIGLEEIGRFPCGVLRKIRPCKPFMDTGQWYHVPAPLIEVERRLLNVRQARLRLCKTVKSHISKKWLGSVADRGSRANHAVPPVELWYIASNGGGVKCGV